MSELRDAIKSGDRERVAKILQAKPEAAASPDDWGYVPLYWAALFDRAEIAQLLVDKGAAKDLLARDLGQNRVLHIAAREGAATVVQILLDQGFPVDTLDMEGRTPLHWAAKEDYEDIAELLVARGAPLEAKNNQGRTPLHLAAENDAVEVAEILIRHGANLEALDFAHATPLHRAAAHGQRDMAEVLLRHGAKVRARDAALNTPLHEAVGYGHGEALLELLLDHDADINQRNELGQTPLHLAAENFDSKTADLLIRRGANMDALNDRKRNPMQAAFWTGLLGCQFERFRDIKTFWEFWKNKREA